MYKYFIFVFITNNFFMKKILLLVLFYFLSFHVIYSQYETSHWFFGIHAGLNFQTGAPVPESGGQLSTEEGCSSISDVCGNLLFYTNGVNVYNKNHLIMPNGTGLKGDDSSTQSGIIVPKPNDDNTYYIFTVDDAFNSISDYGMEYSVVDMTQDGGNGDVVIKNQPLVAHASEKVTAVVSSNGTDIWVITLAPRTNSTSAPYGTIGSNMNTFYAFKVTPSGVSPTATISQLPLNIGGGAGYMKVSPDGTKLAIANLNDDSAYLLDFNATTGIVSNPVSLFNFSVAPYGVEFSPDSSKLYIGDRDNRVYQFDLANNNQRTTISTYSNYRSALQLGLDGKIYQTFTHSYGNGSNQLSVIDNPNEAGTACNYRYRFINLGSGMEVRQGLPPFIQSYFSQVAGNNLATGVINNFDVVSNKPMSSVDWDFGDGSTAVSYPDNPPDNTHSIGNHTYTTPGTYTVTAIIHLVYGCDVTVTTEVTIYPQPELLSNDQMDFVFCDDNQTGHVSVNLHDLDNQLVNTQTAPGNIIIGYYPSQTDAENHTNELSDPYTNINPTDTIYVSVYNQLTQGESIGSFQVIVNPLPQISPVSDFEICDTDTDGIAEFNLTDKNTEILNTQSVTDFDIHFYPTQTDAQNDTNEIASPYTNTTAFNETLWYSITDIQTGCKNYGSFNLIVHPYEEISMDDNFQFCTGSFVQIDAPSGYTAYLWSTGDTTQDITVNQAGTITLTVTNSNGCNFTKQITVDESSVANFTSIEIEDFSENNMATVHVEGKGEYEYSIDDVNYQANNTFTGLQPGTYDVYVRDINGCGKVSTQIDILGAPQFFTPNGDGFNDFWQVLNITKRPGTYINIYDRYGKLLKTIFSSDQGWDGTYKGKPVPSTDYWFMAYVKEGNGYRNVKGHFTLKR